VNVSVSDARFDIDGEQDSMNPFDPLESFSSNEGTKSSARDS